MKRLICLLLLCALFLTGCAGNGRAATDGDVSADAGFPASDADVRPTQDAFTLLTKHGGLWRSEQQTVADDGVVVRELLLNADGSFTYREGDWGSEYYYFAAGSWSVDGDFLRVGFLETEEGFANAVSGAQEQTAAFAVSFEDGNLALRQTSDAGFCQGQLGQTTYYYQSTVEN